MVIEVFQMETRGASHCELAIYNKKYLNAKRKIMEIQIFHHAKTQFSKKILQDVITP
jgi:hypothetical protein